MTMKARRHTMWIMVVAAVVFAAAPSAWAQKAQQKNIEDMTAFRAQIEAVRNQIDPVLKSLNAIVEAANANPTAAYKTFTKELGKMDKQLDNARTAKANMQKKGQALFKEWEKKAGAITNPEIKAAAEANRAKLQSLYGSIEPDVTAAKESGNLFVSDLKDLNAYFQVDLSSAGINSVANMISKCDSDGKTVQGLLDRILATLDQVKAQMAPGGTGTK
jgi:DUF2959 family protein